MRVGARSESLIGGLIVGGGMIYVVHIITRDFTAWSAIKLPWGGPVEFVALGIVIWLHGKWRSITRVRD